MALAALLLAGTIALRAAAIPSVPSTPSVPPYSATEATALLTTYCVKCHGDDALVAGLTFEHFDTAKPDVQAELAEKMLRRLKMGMMPPVGEKRPPKAEIDAFTTFIESKIDAVAAARPNPGTRTFLRLNRAEYQRSIEDILDLTIDVDAFLPPDTISHGFDNVADAQSFSPSLMEGYMRAARKISLLAMGDRAASPAQTTYKVPRTASQLQHVDGAPIGTRGGISVVHNFPADGMYSFRVMLHSTPTGQMFGSTAKDEKIEISVNGERKLLLDIDPRMSESSPNGMNINTEAIAIKAGPQRISAAFIPKSQGMVDDLISPIEHTLADTQIGSATGITTVPHLRDFAILGPTKITGVSETPSRRRILSCRPKSEIDAAPCASKILASLATEAYRRPASQADVSALMKFYEQGRNSYVSSANLTTASDSELRFEEGVRTAIQAMLASPSFVFRLERAPAAVKAGANFPIADLDLATRLSYFLWATLPDQTLLDVAAAGKLKQPAVLEQQVRRMLADPKASALSTRFASQWLRLQDLEGMHPDALLYPQYDHTLGEAMRTETEMFFNAFVREDRDIRELLTADFTFVNDRLAQHYGIPNVGGPNFRRVTLSDPNRRGLLGQGSILTLTSVADRTSPVQRGKWIMEVLLGTSPPPPPPNIPAFTDTKGEAQGRLLTVRERMEEHRKNPSCQSCHRVIDPIGLALENFDVTGKWRIKDAGMPVDPVSQMHDGTPITGPASLRAALLARADLFGQTFTEYLMTYALGRRVEYFDMPTVRGIEHDASLKNYKFSSFVLGIVKSAAFQMSRAEAGQ
jgi:mono/diheme cytochrome c family protein